MNHSYTDIRDRLGEPVWWDEYAVPRYCEFVPDKTANIYSHEAVLLLVRCQNCGEQFRVAMSWCSMEQVKGWPALADRIADGSIHYGDPPNAGCCPAGPTMNSEALCVLEYWKRESFGDEWKRDDALEMELA